MRIMFLDDMGQRRDVFKRSAIGHTVDFAITAQQAITLLKDSTYDLIYLDHDLEEAHYENNEDHHEDGRFVARKLRDMEHNHGKIVFVHSLNPNGRANIKSILEEFFDVWLPENVGVSELWKIPVDILFGAVSKYNQEKTEALYKVVGENQDKIPDKQ